MPWIQLVKYLERDPFRSSQIIIAKNKGQIDQRVKNKINYGKTVTCVFYSLKSEGRRKNFLSLKFMKEIPVLHNNLQLQ